MGERLSAVTAPTAKEAAMDPPVSMRPAMPPAWASWPVASPNCSAFTVERA